MRAWPIATFNETAAALILCALFDGTAACEAVTIRVATFNVSLFGERQGEVLQRLESGRDSQARRIAEIIQRVRPHIILLNELDYDPEGETLKRFCTDYLGQRQNTLDGEAPQSIAYPYQFSAPSNTGRRSGLDLNRDGVTAAEEGSEAYAADCWGFGRFEGQYGMAILSQYPVDEAAIRTFRDFRWKDMPGALLPDDAATAAAADWYPPAALERFPLSSKSHWDVPIVVGEQRIHLLASHPTPPVFDGPEDRNGRRNHDEIRFWADYVNSELTGDRQYIYDDAGRRGHLAGGESFVILGDLNSDPHDGDGSAGIRRLLKSSRLNSAAPPQSEGAAEQARLQAGANLRHGGDPRFDTCDPADKPGPGNLRIDYVLPSADLRVTASGVFWPVESDPLFPLVGVHPFPSSDHRLVWVNIEIAPSEE